MRAKQLEGQMSLLDLLVNQTININQNNCYHCVMFESHRCINNKICPEGLHYEEYTGSTVRQCLCATVEIFQDGYIHCPILDEIGCEECTEDFGDGSDYYYDVSQNYQRFPRWKSA